MNSGKRGIIEEALLKEKRRAGSWGKLVKPRIKAVIAYAGKRVLDVGCADGSYVRFLRRRGYDAYGVDLLFDDAWRGEDEALFKTGDICRLPYKDNAFDTVIAFEVLEHIKDVDKALSELYRVTKKTVIISVPNCEDPQIFRLSGFTFHHWADRTHAHYFTAASLRALIEKAGFSVVKETDINPAFPGVLSMAAWHIPLFISWPISRLCDTIPFRRKFFMTILMVVNKRQDR